MGISRKFWNRKNVFVTGHEGFLGSHLTKTLIDLGANVVALDKVVHTKRTILKGYRAKFNGIKGNVANLPLVQRIIQKHKPEYIFHLAAEAIVGTANKTPVKTFKSNIQGTWNILECVKIDSSIKGVIVASSDKAYGSHKKLPYTEQAALQGEHPYDVSKSCADLICQTYYKTFNVPVCITRCGNIYGPGDYNYSRLIPDAIKHALKGKQFTIRSNGKFTRDYIYVQDIVEGYLVLAQNLNKQNVIGEAFNFSCESPMSVLEMHDQIIKACGNGSPQPKILNQAMHEIQDQYLSSSKARQLIKWKPRKTLSQGLKETIAWYKEEL